MNNDKGQWWLMGQFGLLLLLALAGVLQANTLPLLPWTTTAGAIMALIGGCLLLVSGRNLGRSLTALPKPKDDAVLVQTGLYGIVRHPIYFSILLAAIGWSLWRASWLALFMTVVLYVFFDRKATREEIWLREKFPQYDAYAKRVKKLIP